MIKRHKADDISFKNVITFNMDEYVNIAETHKESYHYFMHDYLFNHIDIPKKNINILNGDAKDMEKECAGYEKRILTAGA